VISNLNSKEKNKNMSNRNLASGYRNSNAYVLTEEDIEFLVEEIEIIDADVCKFSFNTGIYTGYSDFDDTIHIKGDVFPDLSGDTATDKMSVRAVLAHEYYGHYKFSPSEFKAGDYRDEMRASYIAAIITPNLSSEDRKLLMLDAYDKARLAGQYYEYSKKAKEIIYGY
jgi:hypothetical protein